MRIAVDAMGGDHAPGVIVEGAVQAARDYGIGIDLVGDEVRVREALVGFSLDGLDVRVIHAPQTVAMDESPSVVVRKKRESSIWIANQRVAEGECQAVISAGNTGACMATSLFVLKTLPGVERPAIAAVLPTLNGHSIMLDVGANVDCKAAHLVQFAYMGYEYAKRVLRMPSPRVGVLSIGEEEGKGSSLTKEVHTRLKSSPVNFIGNIEGRDLFNGNCDVIVCDGFIGNVALKTGEGLVETVMEMLRREIRSAPFGWLGYWLLKPAFRAFKKKVSYSEYGGAPLLGLNGVSIICHGRSDAWAIRNAVGVAKRMVEERVSSHIAEDVAADLPEPMEVS
ncbi:MAG: phosphate acyltransferase PlsX [Nitrospirota bacterium]|nr:phosphate acyltransferase PlsX [Nitrospirota bacterium]